MGVGFYIMAADKQIIGEKSLLDSVFFIQPAENAHFLQSYVVWAC